MEAHSELLVQLYAQARGYDHRPRDMALTPGTRLGVYEVGAPLGAGGMGEATGQKS